MDTICKGEKMKIKQMRIMAIFFVLMSWIAGLSISGAAQIKDSESATHDADASAHRVVAVYPFNDFKVIQFELPVLSVYSYLLISGQDALLVDPVRDIATYMETLEKEKATLAGVYLSHSHADFIAGHMEVVRAANCPVVQSRKSGAAYPYQAVGEGDAFPVGRALIKFIETPGHTPDGMCAVVYGRSQPDMPLMMFTGDVLFVGSVGRPDLLEGTVSAGWLAGAMFDSWHQKILPLGDAVKIFPAHGAGSLCGAHLSDEPVSTIGREKTANPYFKYRSRSAFIAALLEGLPEAPQYFRHNSRMNREGPPLVDWKKTLPPAAVSRKDHMTPERYYLVDVRDAAAYAAGHIPGAVNIGVRGRLETWVGIMVPWGQNLILVGEKESLEEAGRRLLRVGYTGETLTMAAWEKAGLPVVATPPIAPRDLYGRMQSGNAPVIVDVRLPTEWMALKIGTVLNLPLNRLHHLCAQLDPMEPVVAVCNSAYRSSLAVGVLERHGFKTPMSLDGGSEAWIQAGLPVYESAKDTGSQPTNIIRYVRLPERMSAEALKRMMMDLPGTFDLVDIRPPAHFSDYHLPNSRNVDVAALIDTPTFLVGKSPLILVDRDGSIAMAVAGILSQKTERPIKVLYGGLEAYWSIDIGTDAATVAPGVPDKSSAPSPAPGDTGTPPGSNTPPKRKSAGC